jgi:hypothetical protein
VDRESILDRESLLGRESLIVDRESPSDPEPRFTNHDPRSTNIDPRSLNHDPRSLIHEPRPKKYDIDLTYITSRGKWYFNSWKGDINKSGGVATNIGIHFFDMLIWVFGAVRHHEVHYADDRKMAGYLELESATVRWFLSVDRDDVPEPARTAGKNTFRSLRMNGEEFEFSEGFTDLHTVVYRDILNGKGFGMEDARPSINLAYELRNSVPVQTDSSSRHPFVKMTVNRGSLIVDRESVMTVDREVV